VPYAFDENNLCNGIVWCHQHRCCVVSVSNVGVGGGVIKRNPELVGSVYILKCNRTSSTESIWSFSEIGETSPNVVSVIVQGSGTGS
jgi:hypothetical protein